MARVKKSRKIGQIGVPKQQWEPKKSKESQSGKPKKHKGNKSGSRQQQTTGAQSGQQGNANRDPRLGSKKPIPLVVEAKSVAAKPAKPSFFSPRQELQAIEDDTKLSDLLDAVDQGKKLSSSDQAYVDSKLARHHQLCELLGIDPQDQADEEDEDDPLRRFESIDINKLK